MKVLKQFDVTLTDSLSYEQEKEALAEINNFYLGDTECNELVDGTYQPKYPEKESAEFEEAHYNIRRGFAARIKIGLLENGTFVVLGASDD
jgi:hypothetical protein